jgi:putative hydrolase
MKIEIDTHTHTVLSGHAHSTILENAQFAKKAGLKGIVTTDHGPEVPGGPPEFNIGTYYMIPEKIDGIRIYRGIEANISDYSGEVDISQRYLEKLDFAIASLHEYVIKPGAIQQNTKALIGAINNPFIDSIGHPGNPNFEIDRVMLVKEAKRLGKILEINNHSFTARKGSRENCVDILKLCMENEVRIAVASDAHICFAVGLFDHALKEIMSVNFPKELIINLTKKSFEKYLAERKSRHK